MRNSQDPLNRPLPAPRNLWELTHGFFWYNDQEIFHDSEEDLNRKAEALAEVGINHVMTFSCTHFRWSFYRHWDVLTETLARIVRACHRYGIYVTEHHSAVLWHNPQTAEEWDHTQRILEARGSSIESWPHFHEDAEGDPVLFEGHRRSELCKVDPETGKRARSNHRGFVMCPINPLYRRAYFAYLSRVYATGVDGIMTDDVGGICGCTFCDRLYRDQTGYAALPSAAEQASWGSGSEDPRVIAWHEVQCRAIEDYHSAVKNHYESLGLRPLRPNYTRRALHPAGSYCLQSLPHLDIVFQEAGGWDMTAYSWPRWGAEAAHRFSVGRVRRIPSMLMAYPHREDVFRLMWGLATSWGNQFISSMEGRDTVEFEGPARAFERRHARLLQHPSKIARIGFYDSERNRELGPWPRLRQRTCEGLVSWIRACEERNIPFDLFSAEELVERLTHHAVIVLKDVFLLSGREITEFLRFVKEGGVLVWAGASGTYGPSGLPRTPDELAALLGIPGFRCLDEGHPIKEIVVGKGKIVLVPGDFGMGAIEPEYRANVFFGDKDLALPFQQLGVADKAARRDVRALLESLMPGGFDMRAANLPAGVTATVFLSRDRRSLAVHLLNTTGLLDKEDGEAISFRDPIPFPSHAGGAHVTLTVRKPRAAGAVTCEKASCHSLANIEPRAISVHDTGAAVELTLAPAMIQDYLLIDAVLVETPPLCHAEGSIAALRQSLTHAAPQEAGRAHAAAWKEDA